MLLVIAFIVQSNYNIYLSNYAQETPLNVLYFKNFFFLNFSIPTNFVIIFIETLIWLLLLAHDYSSTPASILYGDVR